MSTLIRKGPTPIGSTPVGTVRYTDDDLALVALSSLVDWWRADKCLTADGWRGAKANTLMAPTTATLPTLSLTGGANSKPCLNVASGAILQAPTGSTLLPLSASFTVAYVGRLSGSSNGGVVVGNATGAAYFGFSGANPTQTIISKLSSAAIGVSAGYYPGSAGVKLIIHSYEWVSGSSQTITQRINGSVDGTQTGNLSAFALTNQQLQFFATGGSLSVAAEIEDIFIFNKALCAAANAADLAALETYVHNRYAIF